MSFCATRFPSPLIKPDVRISRIRLSDWLHREHAAGSSTSVLDAFAPPRLCGTSLLGRLPALTRCFTGLRQVTCPRLLRQAHQKSGSFPPPALPDFSTYYDPVRLPHGPAPYNAVEAATLAHNGSPPITRLTVSTCRAHYPGGPVQVHTSAASPDHAAFPGLWAGRRPQLPFRSLLRLHSRYGPSVRSPAQGGVRRRASIQPITQPNRLPATGPTDHCPGGTFTHKSTTPLGRTRDRREASLCASRGAGRARSVRSKQARRATKNLLCGLCASSAISALNRPPAPPRGATSFAPSRQPSQPATSHYGIARSRQPQRPPPPRRPLTEDTP